MTFASVYAFTENFVLPISHDEVVHGKGSMLGKMPGDAWQRFANLRAYYGFMWGHPGKKLLFMGQKFARPGEWDEATALDWAVAEQPLHEGVQRLVRDLNHHYRDTPMLHVKDCDGGGFEWLIGDAAHENILAWLRKGDPQDSPVAVLCNFSPVPRRDFRVGSPTPAGGRRS